MDNRLSRRTAVGALALTAISRGVPAIARTTPALLMQPVLDYVHGQKTTGLLVIRDRRVLVEENWPAPAGDTLFKDFAYETTRDGALLEDVASQQKSFVSMLVAIAVERGLIDFSKPIAAYIGSNWSKATVDEEAKIRVIDVLTMSSGLGTDFSYAAPPGTTFLYNTPVYAIMKRVLAAATKASLETTTHDWLTAPAGMDDTSWRKRPAAFADVGNPTGLVTSPRDTAAFGQIILDRGLSKDGRRIVTEAALATMFARSQTNPAYGHLWWMNGSSYTIRPLATRTDGPLIPAAPADLVAALGALDRKLYVVPSMKLLVVRMGAAAPDKGFDQQLWLRLAPALSA